MNTTSLENKVVLITGAASGIGKTTAESLAKAGAKVIVNYHNKVDAANELKESIIARGGNAITLQADVSDESSVQSMFNKIKESYGSVDILVNNAGMGLRKPFDQLTLSDWQLTLNVNLTSAFIVTKSAVPAMIEKGFGRIINISSVAAQTGGAIGPHYAASKAGMIGLTHSYANLLAKYGITVNAIAPALIETDMIRNLPNVKPGLAPIQRFGLPEEIADVVLLLATNGFITGQTFNVNGGMYMS